LSERHHQALNARQDFPQGKNYSTKIRFAPKAIGQEAKSFVYAHATFALVNFRKVLACSTLAPVE
jgi:hypothetical protein